MRNPGGNPAPLKISPGLTAIDAVEALTQHPGRGHGYLTVSAVRTGSVVSITVDDTGPGMPPKARENLFAAFRGSARSGGTGLGLAIARELVLAHGGIPQDPFFEMQPDWALLPVVLLATAATVIASQAVITGAFSLTRQAVQLNLLPRFVILHTSETQSGQVYMPRVNLLIALGVMLLVVGFQESSALASAYGISVTGDMLMTTVLLAVVMRRIWNWPLARIIVLIGLFGLIDIGFFASNIVKVFEGGWTSLLVAGAIIVAMSTWVRGVRLLFEKTRKTEVPLDFLAGNLAQKPPTLVAGTAVFLTSDPQSAPTASSRPKSRRRCSPTTPIRTSPTAR